MVKRQKEKQYNSAREQRDLGRSRGSGGIVVGGTVQRKLPFDHCALTLSPFENPVCNREGVVFENSSITPFVLKRGIDPVTGNKMTTSDLITLNMDRSEDDDSKGKKWQCPVLGKPFADHTKIVAIVQRSSSSGKSLEANVYSYEAYHELNVKSKCYEDLVSGAKFDKNRDVIVLNDPNDDALNSLRDINNFYHIRHARELKKDEEGGGSEGGGVRHSKTASRIMEQLQQKKKESDEREAKAKELAAAAASSAESSSAPADILCGDEGSGKKCPFRVLASDVTGVAFTTGAAATSLTSTAVASSRSGRTEHRDATRDEILKSIFNRMKNTKNRKGYVRLAVKDYGNITLELHCDMVPKTCANFLGHCRAGTYLDADFHRLIPNFMIQGGKAKGDGADKSFFWGTEAFGDEFDDRLKHTGMGVLSMANSGPHTNKQQFFLTFKSCHHLDRKHSVFGQVVRGDGDGGLDVLKKLEHAPVDSKRGSKPKKSIRIVATDVLVDPYEEAREQERKRLEKIAAARDGKVGKLKIDVTASAPSKLPATTTTKTAASDVGRYLKDKLQQQQKRNQVAEVSSKRGDDDSDEDEKMVGIPSVSAATTTASSKSSSRLAPAPKKTKFGDFQGW